MAIEYVGGVSSSRNGNSNATTTQSLTTLTGGLASQPAAGDLVLVVCVVGSQGRNASQAISGYTTIGTQLNPTAATYDTSLQVSYKIMTSTPDTSITIPAQGNVADGQAWAVQVFRGVAPGTIFDVSSVSATGTATGRFDAAAITPSTAGTWIVIAGGGAAATGAAYTAPSGFATNWVAPAAGADTNDAMAAMGYYTGWTSGSYNPAAVGGGTTGATDSWAVWTMALQPAKIIDVTEATPTISGTNGPVGDESCNFTQASLTASAQTVILDESVTVTSAAPTITPTTLTLEKMADPASLSVSGQAVVLDEAVVFTKAALSVSGQTVVMDESATVGNASLSLSPQDVALDKTGGTNTDCPVDSASLSVVGQTVVQDESIATLTPASLSVSGQAVAGDESCNFAQAALQPQGSTITGDEGLPFTQAALSTSASVVALDEGATVGAASPTIAGSVVIGDESATVGNASLSISGSSIVGDESVTVTSAALSVAGSTIALDKTSGSDTNCAVDSASLSVTGTTLTIERVADAASLSVSGQTVALSIDSNRYIDVTPAALTITGTTITREVMSNPAALSVSGQTIELVAIRGIVVSPATLSFQGQDIGRVFGQRYLTADPTPLTTSGQWITLLQEKEYDEATLSVVGQSFTSWDFGILVTEGTLSVAGSVLALDVYTTASVNVTAASLTFATQDVTMPTTQQPLPPLDVDHASLTIDGQNVILERPPLDVVAASLTIQGTDMVMSPPQGGRAILVDSCSLFVDGEQGLELELRGSFTVNVTHAQLTLTGIVVGVYKDVITSNEGKIDGRDEWMIDTAGGGVILYAKNGGYYVVSKD